MAKQAIDYFDLTMNARFCVTSVVSLIGYFVIIRAGVSIGKCPNWIKGVPVDQEKLWRYLVRNQTDRFVHGARK